MDQTLLQIVDMALEILDRYEDVLSDEMTQTLKTAIDDCMNVINEENCQK